MGLVQHLKHLSLPEYLESTEIYDQLVTSLVQMPTWALVLPLISQVFTRDLQLQSRFRRLVVGRLSRGKRGLAVEGFTSGEGPIQWMVVVFEHDTSVHFFSVTVTFPEVFGHLYYATMLNVQIPVTPST